MFEDALVLLHDAVLFFHDAGLIFDGADFFFDDVCLFHGQGRLFPLFPVWFFVDPAVLVVHLKSP